MKKLNFFTGFFLIALFVSMQISAADQNTDQGVYKLGEIVVSAQGTGVEKIGTVRVVTAEEIEMSGAETLDEAIRILPGIMVRTGGQGVPRPDLRGMKPRHVTLLIDGIPFNSPGDGQFDPSLISTENIAMIKVSYGNDSVLYGPGGLGGVINVITKKGTDKTKFDIEGRYAEKDIKLGRASVSGGNSILNYFLSASKYVSDGYRLSDDFIPTDYEDGGTRNNSDKKLTNVFGNLGFNPNDRSQAGFIFNYIKGDQGIPPITLDNSDPFGKNPKYERVDDKKGLGLSLSGSHAVDDSLSFRGWVYVNNYDEYKNRYDDNTYTTQTKKNSYHVKEATKIKGANLQTRYFFNDYGNIAISVGTKEESFDSEGWELVSATSGGGGGGGGGGGSSSSVVQSSLDGSHDISTHTVAAEYDVEPIKNMGFVAGYGYSWFEKENGLDDSAGDYLIGMDYNFSENSRIKASVADKIRFPSVTQLYGVDEGNPNLDTEKSTNYELGYEHSLSNIKTAFSITGFRRDVKNYISKDTDGVNQNNEKYKFQGVEVTARNQSVENLDLRLAYTYMDAKDKSTGTLVDQVQYNPEHKLAIEGTYYFPFDISAYASIERIENQYYYNSDNTLKGKLPDYTIVNLKIEKTVSDTGLKLYIGANNLFDENYFESYALPREGRSVFCGLRYSIK